MTVKEKIDIPDYANRKTKALSDYHKTGLKARPLFAPTNPFAKTVYTKTGNPVELVFIPV